jgi:hypothetical protein
MQGKNEDLKCVTIEYYYILFSGEERGCVFGLILRNYANVLNNRNRFKGPVSKGMEEHTWSEKSLATGQLCKEFFEGTDFKSVPG